MVTTGTMAKAAIATGGRGDWQVLGVLLFAIAVSIDGFAAGVAEGLRGIRVPIGSLLAMNVVSAVVVFLSLGSGRMLAGLMAPLVGRLVGGGILMALGGWMLWRGREERARVAGPGLASGDATGAGAGSGSRSGPGSESGRRDAHHPWEACRVDGIPDRWPRGAGNGVTDAVDLSGHARTPYGQAERKAHGKREDIPAIEGGVGRRPKGDPGARCLQEVGSRCARRAPSRPGPLGRLMRSLAIVPGLLDEPARADLDSSGILTAGEALLLGLALAMDALGVGFGAGMAGLSGALTPLTAGVTQFVFVSTGIVVGRRMKTSVLAPNLEKVPGGILILLGLMRLR